MLQAGGFRRGSWRFFGIFRKSGALFCIPGSDRSLRCGAELQKKWNQLLTGSVKLPQSGGGDTVCVSCARENFNDARQMNSSVRYWALGLWALGSAAMTAGTIYFDDFSGTGGLDGTAPDIRAGSETWSASAEWALSSGEAVDSVSGAANAFLPFEPVAGMVYTLTMDIDISNSTQNWVALGFTNNPSQATSFHLLGNSSAWSLVRGNVPRVGSEVGYFPGPGVHDRHDLPLSIVEASPSGTFDTLKIVLDTRDADWSATWSISPGATGAFAASWSHTYASGNPAITHVGFGKEIAAKATVKNFRLEEVPEPADATLLLLLLWAGLLRRRRG